MKKAMIPIAWKRDGWMRLEEDLLIATLSDEGTIRGASRKLYISQPALSQRLKQIEQRFGEPLFIRTHKSLIPTPVGEEVIAFAKRRVQEEKQLQDRLSKLTGTVRGTLSLGISSVIAQYVLPKPLRAYVNAYPDVKIDLHTGLSSAIYQNRHHTHLRLSAAMSMIKKGLRCYFLNGFTMSAAPILKNQLCSFLFKATMPFNRSLKNGCMLRLPTRPYKRSTLTKLKHANN